MRALVTVTERHTYDVDLDELLVHLGHYKLADSLGSAGASIYSSETVLVEIEYVSDDHRRNALQDGQENLSSAATDRTASEAEGKSE